MEKDVKEKRKAPENLFRAILEDEYFVTSIPQSEKPKTDPDFVPLAEDDILDETKDNEIRNR